MKRQRAIDTIRKHLDSIDMNNNNSKDAELILKSLEKLGMLPPYSNEVDLGCECGCKGRCHKGYQWSRK